MHTTKARLSALTVGVCLLLSVALGGVMARAAGWDLSDESKTITVSVSDTSEIKDDIGNADVVLDVYKIGTATPHTYDQAFDYAMTGEFVSDELAKNLADGAWEDLGAGTAAVVQKMVENGQATPKVLSTPGTLGASMNLGVDGAGVYLVMPRGSDQAEGSLTALSPLWEYTFNPIIVTLPTKVGGVDDDGNINSAYGTWSADAEVELKAERKERFGSLTINKAIVDPDNATGPNTYPATFVFHIVDTATNGKVYKGYGSVYVTSDAGASTTVGHIPAGITVKVTEEYPGGHFQLVSANDVEVEIKSDGSSSVSFTNKPTTDIPGSGIENHFKLGEDGDWAWTATPADSATDATGTTETEA